MPTSTEARPSQWAAWATVAGAIALQVLCGAALVWSWEAGFGGADAPWSEAAAHSASNAAFAVSAAATLLNGGAIYLSVTRMPWPLAALACLALVPACLFSTASVYGLLVVTGWA